MEKKTYSAPKMRVHTMMLESVMNQFSLGDPNSATRIDMSSVMAKGCGGPIIDDDDFEDDDFDY